MKKGLAIKSLISIVVAVGISIYIGINYGKEPVILLFLYDFHRNLTTKRENE